MWHTRDGLFFIAVSLRRRHPPHMGTRQHVPTKTWFRHSQRKSNVIMRSNPKRWPGISTASFNAFLECLGYMISGNVSARDWIFVADTKSASGHSWLTDVCEQTYKWGLRSKREEIIKFGVRFGYNSISKDGNSIHILIAVPSAHRSVYFKSVSQPTAMCTNINRDSIR